MVNVRPAIVAVPVRAAPVLFALALTATLPLPIPDAGGVSVSHGEPLAAVQLQPACVNTKTVLLVAPAPAATLTGDIEYVHVPPCVIWKTTLPIEILALRAPVLGLAATVKPIVPGPVPDPPDARVIHA
jgi:hypothetical protein